MSTIQVSPSGLVREVEGEGWSTERQLSWVRGVTLTVAAAAAVAAFALGKEESGGRRSREDKIWLWRARIGGCR